MTSGDAIRGVRVGSGPMVSETERGESAPRQHVEYWCANGHRVLPSFAAEVSPPEEWECARCGQRAGRDPENPPDTRRTEPYKSHLAYVQERRTESDGAALLDEALDRLRSRRGDG